tara:strand:+ start:816 stop:1040 length:225 start_codon:yes stop_codon:yes gene_type:complete
MIVNNSCNNLTLNNIDFWGDSTILNTNVKLDQCVDDKIPDKPHEFKKRLKIKSNRFKRLHYNNEQNEKNYRHDR